MGLSKLVGYKIMNPSLTSYLKRLSELTAVELIAESRTALPKLIEICRIQQGALESHLTESNSAALSAVQRVVEGE